MLAKWSFSDYRHLLDKETVYVPAKAILTIVIYETLVEVKDRCDSLTNEWYYTHTGKCTGEGGCTLFKHIIPAFAWNE